MADTDFGQLWVELNAQNKVSPQLRQIINDFQLVDNSVARTKKRLEEFSDVEVSKNTNQIEKNWRSVRGAIVDFKTEIDKLKGKLKELDDLGIGRETNAYRKYEEQLKKLISLRRQLMDRERDKRGDLLGSDDITRFKSELSIARKEVANTDIQAKKLVETQRQNVSAVERMVSQYDRMSTALKSARQSALDSGMTTMGTQYLQNTINRIQSISDALRQALNNPASITTNMVQQAQQQFERLEQMAKNHASRIKEQMSARLLMVDSQAALTKMETGLERIRNKLQALKDDKKITVNTADLDLAKQKLEDFINRYKRIITSGNLTKGDAKRLAEEYTLLTNEAEKARVKVEGLAAAERSRASASMQRPVSGTVEALRQTQAAMDPIIQKMQQLQSATTRTGVVWEQFKTQIAFTAFSVYGLEHFLKSIITVGGEFERQRVALQNMLGDMREASEIFGQLKNLALESPFTFRQLSTYTKQLAAFSIPYEELYDTNRRLSDMSAGLGVDMSRLILAYGQVRAATVLRGQELRQFTEAGVPMVEKLADYFTKLNGELVTTRDIFQMISKKQVPFEAVRAVMQEMTDEGGMFYNMQAKIADTLSGRWGNLKDAWEIMLGSLADSESLMGTILKKSVEGITQIIRHLTIMSGILGGLATGKALAGAGIMSYSAMGGAMTGSTDKFYLKAKQMRAMELQRLALTKELDPIERNILATKNKITVADRISMIRNGQIDQYQAAILMKNSQLSRVQMMRLALENGMTKEEIRQLAIQQEQLVTQSKGALVWGRMKQAAGNFFSGINWASIGITAGIMAIGAIVGHLVQKYNELREAQKKVAEEARTTNEDISKFLATNQLSSNMDTESAMRAVEKYDEELKKVSPNYLEIKSRIIGEHGESPQEQAMAYRDALQNAMNGAYLESDKGTGKMLVAENDLPGWDDASDLFNREARSAQQMREAINSIAPQRIIELANHMQTLDANTRVAVRNLVDAGKKVDAIRTIMEANNTTSFNFLGISGEIGMSEAGYMSDRATQFVEDMAEKIRTQWSEYFEGGQFQEGKEMAASAKEGIMQALRNYVSVAGYDEQAGKNFIMAMSQSLFGDATGATEILADAFVKEYAGQKDAFVKAAKEAGDKLPPEYEAQLHALANSIAFSNGRFRDSVNSIFADPMTLVQSILLKFNVDTHLQPWQEKLIEDFGEQYAATIKAQPDIPSALEAITKLYKEARDKVNGFKPLMLQMGVDIKTPTPLQTSGSWWESLLPWQKNAVDQYNEQASFIEGFKKNQQQYGLKEPKEKGASKRTGGGKKEDQELKAWQRHVELYKKFLDQYRELTKMYGEKEALDKLQTSKAYEWIISFAKARGLDATDIDSMNEALNGILNVNKGDKQKRKDAMAKRTADLEAEGYKRAGEELKRLNDQLNENLKRLNDQYDAYLKIFQITGNKEGAMQLAFGGNVTNERYVDALTEQLRDALKAVNWSGTIDDALDMTKEKVNEVFGEESEAANLINKTKEERNKLEKEYIDILANALTSDMSLEDKRAEAVRKYNEELRKLIALREKAETAEGRAQVQAGIDALNNTHNRTMAGYDQQIFERDVNLGGLINHLNTLSKGYLRAILVRLRDSMSKYANDNTPEGMAARERLADQIMKVTDALKDLNDTVTDLDDDFYTGGDGKRYITGVTATRYGMKQDQEIDENTETIIRNAEEFRQLTKKISQISTVIKDLENVLKPVLDLFESIGYEGSSLSQAIQMASNALSAASNMTSSLSSLSQSAAAAGNTGLASGLAKAGPYAAVAAVGLSVVSQMFKWQQQAIQADIDASKVRQKEMESLTNNLERVLERTLGGIYSMRASDAQNSKFSDVLKTFKVYNEGGNDALAKMLGVKGNFWNLWTYSQHDIEPALEKIRTYTKETRDAMQEALNSDSYYDANYASLLAQRDEMQRQLDLENDKKKRDLSAISDLEQNIIEIQDKIQYYALDIAKAIYDIDVKSWADSLAETIVDAWAKGEDAVDAYKKKVKEIMRDVVTNIISQKIIQEALKRANVEEIITSEMNAKNGMLDEFSVKAIGDALLSATDQAVGNATKLLDYLKSVGWDLSDTADNASTFGKGIASITEDTADLLASYINAIRADVAAIRALDEKILESGFMDINSNLALQLTELRNISAFAERNALAAERILELFDSVTTVGSSGRKVRV